MPVLHLSSPSLSFLKDRLFWLAVVAGPIVWFLIFLFRREGFAASPLSLVMLLMVVIVYPCLEEIVFRGALQGWLHSIAKMSRTLLPGITIANLLTSVVFSLSHLLNQPPVWAALVFFPSLIFGWARDRYDNITASIVLHAFYNAGFYLLLK